MRKTLILGAAAAIIAWGLITVGGAMGLGYQNVLVGLGAGMVLGLVRDSSPAARAGACLIGFVVMVVFYLLRAGFLPVGTAGLQVSIAGTIIVLTIIAALTRGRLRLWAMLLGAVVFAGLYDAALAAPWFIFTQLPAAATTGLVTMSVGFLIALLAELLHVPEKKDPAGLPTPDPDGYPQPAQVNAGLTVLDGSDGGNK